MRDSWKSATDERFQLGVGWRLGSEDTRAYEIGLLGSLYDSRGDESLSWQLDSSGREDLPGRNPSPRPGNRIDAADPFRSRGAAGRLFLPL